MNAIELREALKSLANSIDGHCDDGRQRAVKATLLICAGVLCNGAEGAEFRLLELVGGFAKGELKRISS